MKRRLAHLPLAALLASGLAAQPTHQGATPISLGPLAAQPGFGQLDTPASTALKTIQGVVVDADGKPVPGASLEVSRAGTFRWDSQDKSDSTGHFTLPLGKGAQVVTAMAPGYAAIGNLVETRPDSEPAPLRLVLAKGGVTLTGTVLDPHQHLVPRGEVWAQSLSRFGPRRVFHTNLQKGSFTLSLPPDGYRVFLRCPGFSLGREFVDLKTSTSVTLHTRTQPSPAGSEVLTWIRKQAVPLRTSELDGDISDLDPIGRMVGEAKLVGLGEATHGTHEFQSIKHRLVAYLVEKKDFTVFAIEEDFSGALAVNDYVLNGKGDPKEALGKLDVEFWDTQEVLELIRWMRAWNADPIHTRKVSFWGFDSRSLKGPFLALHPWLMRSLPAFAERMKAAGFDEAFVTEVSEHSSRVSPELIQKAKGLLADLPSELDAYAATHPTEDIASVRLNVTVGFNYLNMCSNPGDFSIRDHFMAEQAKAILACAGTGAKGMVWAHNGHVALQPDRSGIYPTATMGEHLRKSLGQDYFTIGFSFNRGGFRAWDAPFQMVHGIREFEVSPGPTNSINAALAKFNKPIFVLNLRSLPVHGKVTSWFKTERPMWAIGGGFSAMEPEYVLCAPEISTSWAYDALIHVDRTTPVRLHPSRQSIADLTFSGKAPSPNNLKFTEGTREDTPNGWQMTSYGLSETTKGPSTTGEGKAEVTSNPDGVSTLVIHPFKKDSEKVPVLAQSVDPGPYRGKVVVISAWVRQGEGTGKSEARLWGRIRRPSTLGDYQVDPMKLDGKREWVKVAVELEVAPDATELAYGLSLVGPTSIQVRDFEIRPIGTASSIIPIRPS